MVPLPPFSSSIRSFSKTRLPPRKWHQSPVPSEAADETEEYGKTEFADAENSESAADTFEADEEFEKY